MWLGIKRELMIGGIRICRCERQQQSVYYELEEGQSLGQDGAGSGALFTSQLRYEHNGMRSKDEVDEL